MTGVAAMKKANEMIDVQNLMPSQSLSLVAPSSQIKRLPDKWIDRIFTIFLGTYAHIFKSLFPTVELVEAAKALWAMELSDLTPEDIKRALDSLKNEPFLPT